MNSVPSWESWTVALKKNRGAASSSIMSSPVSSWAVSLDEVGRKNSSLSYTYDKQWLSCEEVHYVTNWNTSTISVAPFPDSSLSSVSLRLLPCPQGIPSDPLESLAVHKTFWLIMLWRERKSFALGGRILFTVQKTYVLQINPPIPIRRFRVVKKIEPCLVAVAVDLVKNLAIQALPLALSCNWTRLQVCQFFCRQFETQQTQYLVAKCYPQLAESNLAWCGLGDVAALASRDFLAVFGIRRNWSTWAQIHPVLALPVVPPSHTSGTWSLFFLFHVHDDLRGLETLLHILFRFTFEICETVAVDFVYIWRPPKRKRFSACKQSRKRRKTSPLSPGNNIMNLTISNEVTSAKLSVVLEKNYFATFSLFILCHNRKNHVAIFKFSFYERDCFTWGNRNPIMLRSFAANRFFRVFDDGCTGMTPHISVTDGLKALHNNFQKKMDIWKCRDLLRS